MQIARLSDAGGDEPTAVRFDKLAHARQEAIHRYLWDDATGAFYDYDWQLGKRREILSAATAAPLFTGVASNEQAQRCADTMMDRLLADGGLATTEAGHGEQWDRPNGWAPLQWQAIEGLRNYGCHAIAAQIASRWLHTVRSEEHTSELQSLMRISYAVFCLKKKKQPKINKR